MTSKHNVSTETDLCPDSKSSPEDICGLGPGKIGCSVLTYFEEMNLIKLKRISPKYCRYLLPHSHYYTCVNPARVKLYKQHRR
jgi:hypothetical protein